MMVGGSAGAYVSLHSTPLRQLLVCCGAPRIANVSTTEIVARRSFRRQFVGVSFGLLYMQRDERAMQQQCIQLAHN